MKKRRGTITTIRTYDELTSFSTFEERFSYLSLKGDVGRSTFGFDRYLNQRFYTSREWKDIRNHVIVRDNAFDLGVPGYDIPMKPIIHHINPMSPEDLLDQSSWILDPNFLVTTQHKTHNALHFGVERLEPRVVTARSPGDTTLWGRR